MKIDFEKWLDEQHEITDSKREIFNDAVNCYKHGIYRPALLLSYIGFLSIAKDRFLKADKPDPYEQAMWDSQKQNVRNDNKWEEELLNVLLQISKIDSARTLVRIAPFSIDDDTRNQITYWRNRRNDCAHYKNNEITESHVVAFWAFLKSKLPFIMIEGGLKSVINNINTFYNISLTPPDADITPLIKKVRTIISDDNYNEIFKAIAPFAAGNLENNILLPYFYDSKIVSYLQKASKSSPGLFYYFMLYNPEKVNFFLTDPTEIRKFWNDTIQMFNNMIIIYAEMLNASVIPTTEIHEANQKILSILFSKSKSINFSISAFNVKSLIDSGFYDDFISIYLSSHFISANYEQVNFRSEYYINMIKLFGFNKNVIKTICENMYGNKCYPFTFANTLLYFLKENIEQKTFFKNNADDNHIPLPKTLSDLYI